MGKKKASQASQASPERHEPIVDGVVRLYASNGEATDAVDQLYAEQAQFATPELTVEGKEAIKVRGACLAQGRRMRLTRLCRHAARLRRARAAVPQDGR